MDGYDDVEAPGWNTDPEGRFPGYWSLAKAMRLDRSEAEQDAWNEDLVRRARAGQRL